MPVVFLVIEILITSLTKAERLLLDLFKNLMVLDVQNVESFFLIGLLPFPSGGPNSSGLEHF